MMTSERDLNNIKEELCNILMRIGALKFGIFTLNSRKQSPYYIDLRIVPSFPDVFKRVCDIYLGVIRRHLKINDFDRVAGIPAAGIPFATVISYRLSKPFLFVRHIKRLHGRERRIEGIMMPGDRILLIDDLITTGHSLKKSVMAIRAEGGVVTDAIVLLDREEGGKEKLEKTGIQVHTLLQMHEVANTLFEMGAIDEESLMTILKQIKNSGRK